MGRAADGTERARGSSANAEAGLLTTAVHGILAARDAAFNLRELLTNPSGVAFLTVKECEKELDQLERSIDGQAPDAIAQAPNLPCGTSSLQ